MADKMCSVGGCTWVGQLRRGMCKKHYRRMMEYGDPFITKIATSDMTDEGRLLHVGWDETPGPLGTNCWIWRGSVRIGGGYGALQVSGIRWPVHRFAYHVWVGPIPEGLVIRHKCDTPKCINPAHLEPGTPRQNFQDMVDRGRFTPPIGARNGQAKLTDELALQIRRDPRSYSQIAPDFEVSVATVAFIKQRRRWTHLQGD